MCAMKIDSRFISTPIKVFALLVICRVGTSGRCGGDPNAWDTDVNDDLPRGVYDRMNAWLCEDLTTAKELLVTTDITYLELSPEAHHPRELFKPLLSGLFWLAERSRVSDMSIVLVQILRDKTQVPLLKSPTPFVHKLDLWRFGTFWVGHWDEMIEGELLWGSTCQIRHALYTHRHVAFE